MNRSRTAWAVALATTLLCVLAQPSRADQPGFAFLEVPATARAAAMGGAYGSVAKGAEAAFWNPAGLATFTGTEFTATHLETYESLRHEQVAMAGRMFGGGLVASLRAMYSEPIPERDGLGNLVGTFGSHDLEFLAGYGRKLNDALSIGFTGQVVRERIADLGATTWAMNAGAAWELAMLKGARASVSVHNVGPAAHYSFEGTPGAPVALPAAFDAGLSYERAAEGRIGGTLALSARTVRGRHGLFAAGGELTAPVGAALRLGMRAGDDVASWSAGVGWRVGGLRVDYAFVPSKLDLEDTHRFTLGAAF